MHREPERGQPRQVPTWAKELRWDQASSEPLCCFLTLLKQNKTEPTLVPQTSGKNGSSFDWKAISSKSQCLPLVFLMIRTAWDAKRDLQASAPRVAQSGSPGGGTSESDWQL